MAGGEGGPPPAVVGVVTVSDRAHGGVYEVCLHPLPLSSFRAPPARPPPLPEVRPFPRFPGARTSGCQPRHRVKVVV